MSRQRLVMLSVIAVFAITFALYLSAQRNAQRDTHGAALLPTLAPELNSVTTVTIRRGSATPSVILHAQGGRWTVAERGDYPAEVSKLRKLLLALTDAKIVEEKTSNPANFSIIGVEDPASPGTAATEISVAAQDGKHTVIIGKSVGAGNFARRAGENRSFSVEPGISIDAEPRFWIDSKLIDLAGANIQSIAAKPATGPGYMVRRAATAAAGTAAAPGAAPAAGAATAPSTAAGNFVLDGVPPGRKAADPAVLAPSSTLLSGLNADDVAAVGDIDFSKPVVATVTLSDGNVITMSGATGGDKHWVQLTVSKDPALNARVAGRAFEIAAYRYDAIFRPLEQMLVPKQPPAGTSKGPTQGSAPGAAKGSSRKSASTPAS